MELHLNGVLRCIQDGSIVEIKICQKSWFVKRVGKMRREILAKAVISIKAL